MLRRRAVALASCLIAVLAPAVAHAAPAPSPSPAPSVLAVEPDTASKIATLDTALAAHWASLQRVSDALQRVEQLQPIAAPAIAELVDIEAEIERHARDNYMAGVPSLPQLFVEAEGDLGQAMQNSQYVEYAITGGGEALAQRRTELATIRDGFLRALHEHIASVDAAAVTGAAVVAASVELRDSGEPFAAAGSLDVNGCPTDAMPGAVDPLVKADQLNAICRQVTEQPGISAAARAAIAWSFTRLGAPYACDGAGRENLWQFDCSSLVVRAYADAAGIDTRTPYEGVSPTTATMLTNPAVFAPVPVGELQPGDLVLYDTCPTGEVCTYRHVVLYLGVVDGVPLQIHTNACGTPAKLTPFWGLGDSEHGAFLGVVRPI